MPVRHSTGTRRDFAAFLGAWAIGILGAGHADGQPPARGEDRHGSQRRGRHAGGGDATLTFMIANHPRGSADCEEPSSDGGKCFRT